MPDRPGRGRWHPVPLAVVLTLTITAVLFWDDLRRLRYCAAVVEAHRELLAESVTDGGRTVLVVGDSYTQGFGLEGGPAVAWPLRLGQQLGVSVTVDGMGGTGFTARGYCGDDVPVTYSERLSAGNWPPADAVVVQGGVNDALTGDPAGVGIMAADVLDLLRETSTVVVVGPPDVRGARDRDLRAIDEALRRVTRAADRPYVPLLSVDLPLLDDGIHPTEAGQRQIAALVARVLTEQ